MGGCAIERDVDDAAAKERVCGYVVAEWMQHHCRVGALEPAGASNVLLARAAFFGSCANQLDSAAECVDALGQREPRTDCGCADDTLSAGMPDAGRRVVLG